ncbi:GntR family transcriptional regulator [Nonomuraea sp. NPDC047529]|uniref:GntR family transcriptional regulator n=1 Tax=Nonomuraea sp. NPDC047529 TaxID=3155623 RepID=UPI003403B57A
MALQDKSDRIDHVGPDLVWRQLAEDVESDIAAGVLAPNAKMPTELELASQYGVSRVTVRRAVKDLAERGLLVVVHGRGTFVSRASAPGAPGTSA